MSKIPRIYGRFTINLVNLKRKNDSLGNFANGRIYKLISLVLVANLLILFILPNYTPNVEAQGFTVKINWKVHSNPTMEKDYAFAVCEAKDYIYIVGTQKDVKRILYWDGRIEMRYKENGSLIKAWTSKDFSFLHDCIIVKDKLYVIGDDFKILAFDLSLNLLTYKHGNASGRATSIAFFDNHLYVAGIKEVGKFNYVWRIEKWSVEDLTLVKEYDISSALTSVFLFIIVGVNPITKQVWVAGGDDEGFRVEILDLELNPLKTIRNKSLGNAYSIDFDRDGNAYIGGYRFIAKYDKDGNEEVSYNIPFSASKLIHSNGLIYVGAEEIDFSDKHILIIYDKNLAQVRIAIVSSYLFSKAGLLSGKMTFDGKSLYVAGIHETDGEIEWVIYSILIKPKDQREILLDWLVIIIGIITLVAILILIFFLFKCQQDIRMLK